MSHRSLTLSSRTINTHWNLLPASDILRIVTTSIQGLHLGSTPATSEQISHLFRLPPEMRVAIYEAAFLDDTDVSDSSDSISLLQTCRQINMEAQPVHYQRPKSFNSQAKLFSWICRSSTSNLERVRTLTIHLTDVDLSPLLHQDNPIRRKPVTAWSLYQAELERLNEVFRAVSNLTSLTVIPPRESRSMLLRNFYRSFLAMIPTRCSKLKKLEVHDYDGEELLISVSTLKQISQVSFTGGRARSGSVGESSIIRRVKLERRDSDCTLTTIKALEKAEMSTSSNLASSPKVPATRGCRRVREW